jgi:hypothetical protein
MILYHPLRDKKEDLNDTIAHHHRTAGLEAAYAK